VCGDAASYGICKLVDPQPAGKREEACTGRVGHGTPAGVVDKSWALAQETVRDSHNAAGSPFESGEYTWTVDRDARM